MGKKMEANLTDHHCILSEGCYPTLHKPAPKSPKLLSIALFIAVEISSFRTWDPNGKWKVRSMQGMWEYKQQKIFTRMNYEMDSVIYSVST